MARQISNRDLEIRGQDFDQEATEHMRESLTHRLEEEEEEEELGAAHDAQNVCLGDSVTMTFPSCVEESKKPQLRFGFPSEILCDAKKCYKGSYTSKYNDSGCYTIVITEVLDNHSGKYYLEYGQFASILKILYVESPGLSTGARVGLGIGIGAVFIGAGIVGYIVLKRQRRNTNGPSKQIPLRDVSHSSEREALCPTSPDHQDGAAGERAPLGAGAVDETPMSYSNPVTESLREQSALSRSCSVIIRGEAEISDDIPMSKSWPPTQSRKVRPRFSQTQTHSGGR
ncbi:hypothetical protein chiPu_0017517 [Chiloscyllium punctatum]|uniref:Uncharacterized protein n=1 Tax=Chiloscyllium punctatum TaxID=137246 RepID=A0A401RGT5_CHIPU|nr:hypothetical protein [Chiloscyllium punctatum]